MNGDVVNSCYFFHVFGVVGTPFFGALGIVFNILIDLENLTNSIFRVSEVAQRH